MSRKTKKIKKKINDIHSKGFEEALQVSAMLKCLEYCCYCHDDNLVISEINLVIRVLQQKMLVIEACIDDLSLI